MNKADKILKEFLFWNDNLAYSFLELFEIFKTRIGYHIPILGQIWMWIEFNRSLFRLERANLIESKHIGNRKYYRAVDQKNGHSS